MAVRERQNCRHLQMQVALLVLCDVLDIKPSRQVLARRFEQTMDRPQSSEENERWGLELRGYRYSEAHLFCIANRVPAVQRLVEHPFWRVLELSFYHSNTDDLLSQYFPGCLSANARKLRVRLARCNELDRLTMCLLLAVSKPNWSRDHPAAVVTAVSRLCAQQAWYPGRYLLARLIWCWLEHMHGLSRVQNWFTGEEDLNFRVGCWQDLQEWSSGTPLVRDEQGWWAFGYVYEQADRSKQQQLQHALRLQYEVKGQVFGNATLHSAYRCCRGVLRRWNFRANSL